MALFEVQLWVEGDGKWEDDERITKFVEAPSGHDAVQLAKGQVRSVDVPKAAKIWGWTVGQTYGCISRTLEGA